MHFFRLKIVRHADVDGNDDVDGRKGGRGWDGCHPMACGKVLDPRGFDHPTSNLAFSPNAFHQTPINAMTMSGGTLFITWQHTSKKHELLDNKICNSSHSLWRWACDIVVLFGCMLSWNVSLLQNSAIPSSKADCPIFTLSSVVGRSLTSPLILPPQNHQ